jgi:hypothetical protein
MPKLETIYNRRQLINRVKPFARTAITPSLKDLGYNEKSIAIEFGF